MTGWSWICYFMSPDDLIGTFLFYFCMLLDTWGCFSSSLELFHGFHTSFSPMCRSCISPVYNTNTCGIHTTYNYSNIHLTYFLHTLIPQLVTHSTYTRQTIIPPPDHHQKNHHTITKNHHNTIPSTITMQANEKRVPLELALSKFVMSEKHRQIITIFSIWLWFMRNDWFW